MRVKLFFFLSMFFLTTSQTYSGTISHNVSDNKYLEYGQQHGCVARLGCKTKDGANACGSCVIINPHWIITAAHVVKDCEDIHILLHSKIIKMKRVIIKKEFDGLMSGDDIALCESSELMELDFYPQLYDKDDELNKVCSICGFGSTGTGLTGAKNFDYKKRAGSNIVDNINEDMLFCTMNKPGEKDTSLEYCISHGDSGGGLFIDKKLAGINSMVLAADKKPDANYGDESGHTRISKYKAWIEENIK